MCPRNDDLGDLDFEDNMIIERLLRKHRGEAGLFGGRGSNGWHHRRRFDDDEDDFDLDDYTDYEEYEEYEDDGDFDDAYDDSDRDSNK